ncbi:MAG TPA: nuclear transport factor 2 family protein [Acidobacteriaceae bacterium]|nr:nuclear transport factor 2 family protein [Acidobacteriaceae bacterium]
MHCKRIIRMPGIILFAFAAFLAAHSGATAQTVPASGVDAQTSTSAAIHAVMDAQVAAWNRGDVVAFMQGYKDSPDTTFVSDHVAKGYQNILARYRKAYTSKSQMGTLQFSELEVRPLCPQYASVTGRFHLARTAAAGGDAGGVFSLLFQRTPQGWRIILDHTSSGTAHAKGRS